MPEVVVVQVIYNHKKWIDKVFAAVFAQTFRDFQFVAVIAGNADGSKEHILKNFPQVEVVDPGFNIGFAAGHNLVFEKYPAEFYQLVNPDMIMRKNYIEEMLMAFRDQGVGAATGKLYRIMNYELASWNESKILDTTGVIINKSGRAKDRGQNEEDLGQYDKLVEVDAVSGAGCMYRRKALENIKLQKPTTSRLDGRRENLKFQANAIPQAEFEYFDEDFHSYWEDVDLSWRLKNKGWKNVFVPQAIGFHGRAAGSSRGGYLHLLSFIKHHRTLPENIRQLNFQNHIFMYIKNSPYFYPQFFIREFFMIMYILAFEISVLKILPEASKLLPKMWKKRMQIKRARLT